MPKKRIRERTLPDGTAPYYAIHPKTEARIQIDPEQRWFWTEEWQTGERAVDEELWQANMRNLTT